MVYFYFWCVSPLYLTYVTHCCGLFFFFFFGVSDSKGVGIQTEKVSESDNSSSKDDLFASHQHQNKLLDIWDSFNGQSFGRNLVPKLFSTCEVDFHVLFGYLNFSFPSKSKTEISLKSGASLMDLSQSSDAAKVSHLYFMLTKVNGNLFFDQVGLHSITIS